MVRKLCLTDGNVYTRVGDRLSGKQTWSEPSKIISGVIQGSCIGPLLFMLYINSLAHIFDNNTACVLFADDVKLYTLIKCHYQWRNYNFLGPQANIRYGPGPSLDT